MIVLNFFRELSLQRGDIVYIHRQVDANWFEGEHHGRAGIFPTTYVEVNFFLFMLFLCSAMLGPCVAIEHLFILSFTDSATVREAYSYKVPNFTGVGLWGSCGPV